MARFEVQPGRPHLPVIPEHVLKATARLHTPRRLLDRRQHAAQQLRSTPGGDENNQDISGKVPGYVLVNLDARYRAGQAFEVFARIANLFDTRYYNFAVLGDELLHRTEPYVRTDGGLRYAQRAVSRTRGADRSLAWSALCIGRRCGGCRARPRLSRRSLLLSISR